MRAEEFGRQLEGMRQRVSRLDSGNGRDVEALEELLVAVEELRVADEELRAQNEALAAAQEALEEQRRRYEELFDQAPDAYIVTDAAGVVRDANQAAARLLGIAPRFLLGKAIAAFVHLDDRSKLRAELARLNPGQATARMALRLEPREHQPIDVDATLSMAPSGSGASGVRWLLRDVTEQRRLEEDILSLNRVLETRVSERTADLATAQKLTEDLFLREQAARHAAEASEARARHVQKLESIGVLAGGIAHDFNNLLHVILGNADLALLQLPADSPAEQPLREAMQATLRAADLTRQMLAYSGKGAFVVQDLDLSHEVREMATLLRSAISKQATLVWDLLPDPPAVRADATQVRQIVMNLITNASDALGEGGGSITLRTGTADPAELGEMSETGPCVFLEVSDTGCGMSPDTLQRIFDPFFSTKFSGRGLGLAAVIGIVEGHRGLIRVRTTPGEGTSFRVLLPALDGRQAPLPRLPAEYSAWRGEGTVLVVDDEEDVRDVAARMLQGLGFQTLTAADGREALRIVSDGGAAIVAVLLDLSMPRLGGEEAYRRLRADHPDLHIVLMSGYTEQAVGQHLSDAGPGITSFLQKPFLFEDLAVALRLLPKLAGKALQ